MALDLIGVALVVITVVVLVVGMNHLARRRDAAVVVGYGAASALLGIIVVHRGTIAPFGVLPLN